MSGLLGWPGRDDLIGLTLWLMYERVQGEKSPWQPYLKMFPQSSLSPLLWTPEEQQRLLKGSPALGNSPRGSLLLTGNIGAIKRGSYLMSQSKYSSDMRNIPCTKPQNCRFLSGNSYHSLSRCTKHSSSS